ncbi:MULTISPECIES: helix-turn-helix transcriptional regulator [Stappiaceae]|jgi:DNA-binding PadR family transcriptional regulator|uniref:Transcriptional regulator, Acidobacterial, PadR-family n=2 Tax=Roseibium TaxID=150830 RepID=A0A0M6XYP8_9HYPH|nr:MULTISPECIES: helix-turn-helix transcriptional regulator [Stappiaceae]MCR9282492.1 PadR family transcriptional regulator [Paracoccaceae bacterium]MEC9403616.1 helix-turn-helix transcriptional regulator [Pseudomonadota bacterium]AMN53903.1 PadR family transcriptional regulator [Labrenzia sp. CP4]AQQ02308.1 PadR family transcriptional regulator [Roseibium aggregatum]ERP85672.1 PadR family transcriptional regulator [Labrenzia sp. C1B10]
MSVRSLCLAILSFGDATGYEIRKESTEGRFSYFDDASFGSIYPALARLESEGLVTVREEPQAGKPARKVYSITDAGREDFIQSLCDPQAPDTFKSPFLLIALNAAQLPPEVIRRAVERRKAQVHAELRLLTDNEKDQECSHPGSNWTREYGIACMNFTLAYLEEHGEALIRIAEEAAQPVAAAAE